MPTRGREAPGGQTPTPSPRKPGLPRPTLGPDVPWGPTIAPPPAPHLVHPPAPTQAPRLRPARQPPGSPPHQGRAYLPDTAEAVLHLGGGPEQAGGRGGRPQLQDPAEVRGVGGGAAGSRGWWRRRFPALGGQAELLGSPGEGRAGAGGGAQCCPRHLPCPGCGPTAP